MRIDPSHRRGLRRTAIIMAVMACGIIVVWLVPVPPQTRGIANYLPLHLLLETTSIIIATLVFAVGWNAYSSKLARNTIVLGCAFLCVAMLDFSHALSYAGMPDYVTASGVEKAINFWLVARAVAAVALLLAVALPWRPFSSRASRYVVLVTFLAFAALAHLVLLLSPELVPRTFIPGLGLTPFKIWFEYAVIAVALVAAVILCRRMRDPLPFNAPALLGAIGAMAMSELLFTLYADVTDVFNLLGHVYKAISYLFIYRAIFVATVESPYRQLRDSQGKLQATLDALPDLLFEIDATGLVHDVNVPATNALGAAPEALVGTRVREVLDADAAGAVMAAVQDARGSGCSRGRQYALRSPGGESWYELSVARKATEPGMEPRYVVLSHDITVGRAAELEAQRLSMLYAALSRCNEAIVRCGSDDELLPVLCRDVVEFGGMTMAWIGLLDEHGERCLPVAAHGRGAEVLEAARSIPPGVAAASGYGPAARAMGEDRPVWCQDFLAAEAAGATEATGAWHESATRFDWRASATLPLHRDGQVVGCFNLYAGEVGAFDDGARTLLIEMTMDIDFALHNFERERRRRAAEDELAESRNLLRTVVDTAPVRIFWKDLGLRYVGCNLAFAQDAGLSDPAQVVGLDDHQLTWREQADAYRADDRSVLQSGVPKLSYDERQTNAGGTAVWLRTSKVALHDANGATSGLLGIYEDITGRKQAELDLRRSEAELNTAQSIAQVGSWTYDAVHSRLEGSPEFRRMAGLGPQEVIDLEAVIAAIHPDDRGATLRDAFTGSSFEREIRIVVNGETRWINVRLKIELDAAGRPLTAFGTAQDVTDRKVFEDRVYNLAHFDALTGLPNRTQLDARLEHAVGSARRTGRRIALMFLDLDRFKDVNDSLGHSVGDSLLVQLAARLSATLRDEDVVSRLGGDEFIVMMPDTEVRAAAQMAQQLLEVIAEPYRVDDYDLNLTASIGIAVYPEDGADRETLSRSADTAMYRAKQEGRNCYRFFTAEMQERSARNLQLVNDLRHARRRGQLSLVYQPQIDLTDGRLVGVEALLRWQHPQLGAVSPSEFIPIAEDSGLILQIGEWVVRRSVQQLKSWMGDGIPAMVMSVNLSAVQFRNSNLPRTISRILREEDLAPELLELELTEGVAMDEPRAAVATMNKLHERGIRLSLDDFGTGYSSLSYLKEFQVYKLKIDRSFVSDLGVDPDDGAIVASIITIARSLGLTTIAEGVETEDQLEFLRRQGCDEVQGFYFSRPLAPDDLAAFARARTDPR